MKALPAMALIGLLLAACAADQPRGSVTNISGPIVPDGPRVTKKRPAVAPNPAVEERLDTLDQDLERLRGTLQPDRAIGR